MTTKRMYTEEEWRKATLQERINIEAFGYARGYVAARTEIAPLELPPVSEDVKAIVRMLLGQES